MTDRLRGLRRILKVQDQIKREADWRLAEAERAAAEVEAARAELAAFLERDATVGPLAVAAAAQMRRLDGRGIAAARTVEDEARAMREATARQKLMAKGVENLAREDRAARERQDLERLIEDFAARAGLPEAGEA